jgi:hypothetical protein
MISAVSLRLLYLIFRHLLGPRISWTGRALIAAFARVLPGPRRLGPVVTPAMILR